MSHIVMKQVLEQLHLTPRLTCRDLAQRTGFKPGELIDTLRRAVLDGVLAELNGFYALGSPTTSPCPGYPWVEGRLLPDWVARLATGAKGGEQVCVVAETQGWAQKKDGVPAFMLAYLTLSPTRCRCASSGQDISAQVLRYLPFDPTPVSRR
ncbi:MAG: hypothetical protein EKE20_14965 [Candidatus Symbiopectobacterium sp. Dall1.0]|nr:hypothetical protein [Candidatus Symbiopectobacterium sp. Dall1.0]